MEPFVRGLLRHRRWVALAWLLVFLAGALTAARLTDRLSYDFSLPGQPGYETEQALIEAYGTAAPAAFVPVVTVPEGTTVEQQLGLVSAVFENVRQTVPGVRVVDFASTGDRGFLTEDGRSTFGLVYAPPPQGLDSPLQAAVEEAAVERAERTGFKAWVTGYEQLSSGSESAGPSVLVETLIGGLGALAVLAFVFASFLALVPLLVAAVAILTTFLAVLGLTAVADVSFVVQYLIALVGLGVAIDYSLLVVSRWREERARGAQNDDAVVTAVRTAGAAVLASGVTVAVSLLALVVFPVPLLRSMGYGGMLIPLVSVAVVLTLLPVLLSAVGPRVDVPRIRKESSASRGWSAWARGVVRLRWAAAVGALAFLAVLVLPVGGLQFGQARSASLAQNGAAYEGLQVLRDGGVGAGVLTPMSVLFEPEAGDGPTLAGAIAGVPGVRLAVAAPPAQDGSFAVDVVPEEETVDNASTGIVDDVRRSVADVAGFVGVAGSGAQVEDYGTAVYDNFPYVLAAISVITFLLLVRTFRSLLLPLKAVLLNLVSVAAVFGLATWFWQSGNGSGALFGVEGTGAMTFWLPVLIFAFLFGLSMDYEVFILARMREEYDATGSTDAAIVAGLGRTGRLVTSAALILFFAFAALASAPMTDIKVFATALGVGILLDATVVRALLVPALVSLFGDWNWWLPAWLARVVRVPAGPALSSTAPAPEPARAGGAQRRGPAR
ncbi:MMPL family transporter [Motilibacter aurantiacus]|uniref:MMPL family transporter n=1 Tax=Motilibacter aurantiacus TaxID=2714955 RepID=UPI00140BFC68|nr:MMPL family transporter [Motilibacter aurantiacus]NHC47173.1 MMPL family transporter [Motilibacter aurantiacus]